MSICPVTGSGGLIGSETAKYLECAYSECHFREGIIKTVRW